MKKITLVNSVITAKEAFQEFCSMKKRDNISEATIKDYEMMFKIFSEYFDVQKSCLEITEDTFNGYKDFLKGTRDNVNTINTYLRHMRAIFNYFIQRGYTNSFKMQLIKADETIKEVYTDEEIERLLKRPDILKCSFSEYRTWAIINYILGTGNRIKSVRYLLNKDIRYEDRDIFIRATKGRRQYYIPLSNSLASVLAEYQHYRKGKDDDYLFCTETGEQLTTSGLQSAMIRYTKKRNVEKTSEHLLRHTYSKLYYQNGGDIMALNYILGHKDIKMTKHYLNLYCNDIKENFDTANPLDRLTKNKRIIM